MQTKGDVRGTTFDALGSSMRREILNVLSARPCSVRELADLLPVSRPAVSRHLRLLSSAGLVSHREVGTQNLYELDIQGFNEARGWLDSFWGDALGRFKLLAENTTPHEQVDE